MTQEKYSDRQLDLEMTQMRRNPYLVDYNAGKSRHITGKTTIGHTAGRTTASTSSARQAQRNLQIVSESGRTRIPHREHRTTTAVSQKQARRPIQTHTENVYTNNAYADNTYSTRARQRRRRQARIRRYLRISLLCASILVGIIVLKNLLSVPASTAEASAPAEIAAEAVQQIEKQIDQTTGTRIQGLPADTYAAHPNWTEDFLTVNEYSRPGDPLTEVKNIFVHYTANPGTSAAQNRSYFEQLKDNHERSASAHFIIGYDGEILQCVPLDEIAYAVQTRNEDSISIECCYKAENGQFTQETYDSLIRLLKWLTDAYDLQPDDILRHYDCGGKKCPIYYTEHEDAWEKLKQDVKNL